MKRLQTAAMVLLALPLGANAGYYYETVTKEEGNKGRSREVMTITARVDGDRVRVEYDAKSKDGPFAKGNYLVSTDGGETMYLVDSKKKTYARFDMETLSATIDEARAAMAEMGANMSIEFSNMSSDKLLEEPGGEILGYDTTHYRFKGGYTMNMNMMVIKRETRNDFVQDIWTTDELDIEGFTRWMSPGTSMAMGNEEFTEFMKNEFAKVQGFPLRVAIDSTSSDARGNAQSSRSLTEVTVLREESFADSVFSWPSNYTETQLVPDMSEAQQRQPKKRPGLRDLFGQ